MKNIIILGINDGHDASACILKDGKVLAAVQEERPRNIKHYGGFPEEAIKDCFRITGIKAEEIDLIAFASLNRVYDPYTERPLKLKIFEKASPYIASKEFSEFYVKQLKVFRNVKKHYDILERLGLKNKEVRFYDHHKCHAATAYYPSQFNENEKVLVFTADGAGDGVSSTINICEKGRINREAWSTYYNSLGNVLYSEITAYLGMQRWDEEYKVMGLAPYGKAEHSINQIKKIIRINPDKPLEFQNTICACGYDIQKKLQKLLSGHRFDNIAAATQEYFEELITIWVQNAIDTFNIEKLAFSGGLFLNVKANKRIVDCEKVKDFFFYPCAGDDGTAVGAALLGYREYCAREGIKPVKVELTDLYYGPEYSNEEIKTEIDKTKWRGKYDYVENIDETIGELIAKRKIIARFNGRMEWGPRALGNRSILANADRHSIIRVINNQIKHRTWWMPFCPSILETRMHEYMKEAFPARYMNMAFDTTEKREKMVAAIHPDDFTCRPQTVNEWNTPYLKLIKSFESVTGEGVILNTSFNLHGKPIVQTPKIALETLEKSELDGLAIGNYLILRR